MWMNIDNTISSGIIPSCPDQIESAPTSGGPSLDLAEGTNLADLPFFPCFLSFLPLLESTVWLLVQHATTTTDQKIENEAGKLLIRYETS